MEKISQLWLSPTVIACQPDAILHFNRYLIAQRDELVE